MSALASEALARAGGAPTESAAAAFDTWLRLQCAQISGTVSAVLVLGAPDSGPYAPASIWPRGQAASALLAGAAGDALGQRSHSMVSEGGHCALAVPVLVDAHLHGVVALELPAHGNLNTGALLAQLQWGVRGLEALLLRDQSHEEQTTRERLIATLDLVASVLGEDGFENAAQTLATDLAIRLDCDRVSIGFVRNENTQVIAVSHSAEFGQRMNLIRAIGTAMDEALDQKSILLLPPRAGEALVNRDHVALARQYGSDNVLTVPFLAGEESRGAFTFERPQNRPFDADTVELCQAVVALACRILEARRLNERLLAARIAESLHGEARKLLGPRHFGRKLVAGSLMLMALFFSVATGQHRVTAHATLEGAVRRVLVAPYDGYVASAPRRAGDVVAAGTVLATLDDRELRLEYYKWNSQYAQYGKQYQEAVAQHDRALSNITLSQVQQAEAQLNLLSEQLTRTQITAPFEGLVISGDLHQSLGSAVRRGQVLFEVAPLNAYRVILEVDESDIAAIRTRQAATLALTAIPDAEFPLSVALITPVAVARDGRSTFRVEALLEHGSERLRPGMEGVAKIDAGRAKLFWIWTHKLFDWLRLTAWTWI